MDTKKFYDNVRYLMGEKRMRVSQLERDIDCSQGYIGRMEVNDRVPKVDVAMKIAEVFGITVEQLVNGNFGEMSATDVYLLRFIDKLVAETKQDSIKWKQCVRGFLTEVDGARISICQDTKDIITVAIEVSDGLRQEVCSTYRQNEISEAIKALWGDLDSSFRKIRVPENIKNVIDGFMGGVA